MRKFFSSLIFCCEPDGLSLVKSQWQRCVLGHSYNTKHSHHYFSTLWISFILLYYSASYDELHFEDEKTKFRERKLHGHCFTVKGRAKAEFTPGLSHWKALPLDLTCCPSSIPPVHKPSLSLLICAFWSTVSSCCSLRPFCPHVMWEIASCREDTVRTSGDTNVSSRHLWENSDYFPPFSLSLIPFIVSRIGCFSSWTGSSWSSADVNLLKGGVNLITCGTVNATRGALSLPSMLWEKALNGRWAAEMSCRDGTSLPLTKQEQSCKAVPVISASPAPQTSGNAAKPLLCPCGYNFHD